MSYRTKFNARIKQSEVFTGKDIQPEVKALKRMVRYDRNKEYLDQIYYAIGNLYMSARDTANAIANYELAVENSTRSGIDKAIANLTLGGLYYDLRKYSKAQPCYAEAVPVIPETYPDYRALKKRSDLLDELVVYSQNVELQDSLLRLAAMSPEEQLEVVNRIIDRTEKEREGGGRRRSPRGVPCKPRGYRRQYVGCIAGSPDFRYEQWRRFLVFLQYSHKNAGRTEFQRKWG